MKIVGVTACPSGVAHTYLSAESLQVAAKEAGIEMHVETQGSIGTENELTSQMIKEADFVILTTDIGIKNEERFKGKKVLRVRTSDCITKANTIIKKLQQQLAL